MSSTERTQWDDRDCASRRLCDLDVEETLERLEQSLLEIKQRYEQIQSNLQKKLELTQKQQEIKQELENNRFDSFKTELQHLEQELEKVEVELESRLVNWTTFKEPFWQIVRFVGLGIVIGWILRTFVN
jgi:DNA repair exonuclease SbcCD ATPase subunit